MSFSYTPSQKRAIEAGRGPLLVSAAAGSGKTRVLTARLERLVCDEGRDVGSFLIITYTRAAASELRGRIMDALAARAAENPLDIRLRRQQSLCCTAPIGTIHSYCANILRSGSHLLGISPDFKVLEPERAEAIKGSVLDDLLERRYGEICNCAPFRALVDSVGAGRDDSRLVDILLSLHEKLLSHAYPERWARERLAELSPQGDEPAQTAWGRELMSLASESVGECLELMEAFDAEISMLGGKLAAAYGESFSATCTALRGLKRRLDGDSWDAVREALPVPFPRLGALRNYDDPEIAESLRDCRAGIKDCCDGVAATFAASGAELMSELRSTAPALGELIKLTLEFDECYRREKNRRGALDYSDLEHLALKLLINDDGSPTDFALHERERYTEILVDEYQDVNAVQELIFGAVSRGGENLFMVGDVKQSIYRFRLADPSIFLKKSELLAEGGAGERILLRENFRSRRSVLDAVNLVFGRIMSRSLGELDYDEDAELIYGAKGYPEGTDFPVQLHIFQKDDDDSPLEDGLPEARFVASEIRRMLDEGAPVYENGERRPCRPSDFVVLLRSPATGGALFARELAAAGVPTLTRQGGAFFASIEVSVAVDLFELIVNPHADVPLISVLRSPLFSFGPDELSEIRAADRTADFYGALRARAEAGDEKCAEFLRLLGELRGRSADFGVSRLVWYVYERTRLLDVCSALPDGGARRDNLMRLLDMAARFEGSGYRGLFRFVRALRRQAERGEEPERSEEGEGVRIMSIHRSKGLEFPFVFLSGLGRGFNNRDIYRPVLVHPSLGIGSRLTDTERGVEYPTLSYRAIASRLKTENLSEEMRILYVGMTRARERLVMTASWKNPVRTVDKLQIVVTHILPSFFLRSASSPSVWVAAAALHNQDKIELCFDLGKAQAPAQAPAPHAEPERGDGGGYGSLCEALDFRYPHVGSQNLPQKLTATEIKSLNRALESDPEAAEAVPPPDEPENVFELPELGAERTLDAAQRGTATHTFLQYVDFCRTSRIDLLEAEVERLAKAGILDAAQARAVDVRAVKRLFDSPLGRRMAAAETSRREFRFTLLSPASEYFAGASEDDEVLVQGIVDFFMVENGEVTVVDYKTDRVTAEDAAERAKRYAPQLKTYSEALSRILSLPVTTRALFFLRPGTWIEV